MIRLGILGCSEIAYRRFMPAVKSVSDVIVVVVGENYATNKLDEFRDAFNIEGVKSLNEVIERSDIDAVYIPQPPALHYEYAKKSLLSGKHVFLEKPSTCNYQNTEELVKLADQYGLVLHENYMFKYHRQIEVIKQIVDSEEIGEVRLIRCDFGFPLRAKNDFRYSNQLGGGALLDAAGYPICLATKFLGNNLEVSSSMLNYLEGFEVDMYGNATLNDDKGRTCQIAFGMDCQYKCQLEIWGSKGSIIADRIFTAPPDYIPVIQIKKGNELENRILKPDNHFVRSIERFVDELSSDELKHRMYDEILVQARLVEEIRNRNENC